MSLFDPTAYGPVFAPLLATDRRRALGAGTPDRAARGALDALTVEAAFADVTIADRDMALCCVAGVWLLPDFLDESHAISQEIDTPSGSFWHGILHRREGDFANAKYWFRRVGRHDVLELLGQRAGELAAERGDAAVIEKLTAGGPFDPLAFVDMCQSVERGGSAKHRDLCLDIQQAEWELLFDDCYRGARGR